MIFALLCIGAVLDTASGIRLPGALQVYPLTSGSVDLSKIQVEDGPPVRVWASSDLKPEAPLLRTDRSPWSNSSAGSTNFTCTGYSRFGSGTTYSAPISSEFTNQTCSLTTLRSTLWSSTGLPSASPCQCLKSTPLNLSRQFQGDVRCFSTPSTVNGWPVPGLIDCAKYPNLVSSVVYHKFSGQIRSDRMCLTAEKNAAASNKTDIWKPWTVTWQPCSNLADSSRRQSWDVPIGVGETTADLGFRPDGLFLGKPSGRAGQITLRDSGDIGLRCLDIAYTAVSIPVKIQGTFLEAPLCDDARVTDSERAMWKFHAVDSTESSADWKPCQSPACMDCADGEVRGHLGTVGTQGLSVPASAAFNETCTLTVLRQWAVPAIINGTCFCQTHNYIVADRTDLTSMISTCADDLPSTETPSFPPKNTTRKF